MPDLLETDNQLSIIFSMKIALVLIIILIAILGGGFFFYRQSQKIVQPSISPSPTEVSQVSLSPSPATTLSTKYITSQDWPPKVNIENQPFSCTEAGTETDRAGQTEKLIINGHTYCVTKVTEGAAGSAYTQYAYAVAKGNQTQIYTFSLKFVQCGNYSEPENTACEKERQAFSADSFADQYIQNNL